ncbi:MAG: filamentous hemagglutinin N-terminal domain-containing protein [Parachlamydiales bacterium]|nr:filamentous hemagglutinin N-terminal domain-containing protein [Parachlamydiales bacterium]
MHKIVGWVFLCSSAFALPQAPSILSGTTEIASTLDTLNIQASDRSIIEWGSFSIEQGETVRFIQPNSLSAVLNRVIDPSPSRLMGNLESNGQVLLINPNGILVGRDAIIHTGSFIASTLDIQNEVFNAAGPFVFEGDSSESILHLGTIMCEEGDALLVAQKVENRGSISTKDGCTALLGARSVLIKPYEKERIYIREIAFEEDALDFDPMENALSVKHYGQIKSQRSDGRGGEVLLAGELIEIFDGSKIDVSAEKGEGIVRIGGDVHGQSEAIPNARYVRMDENTAIYADATASGSGGKVVLWGQEVCGQYGLISCSGQGDGKGGFVEVSSRGFLAAAGTIDVTASSGRGGTILLDPSNVTIGGGINAATALPACPAANYIFTANAATVATTGIAGLNNLLTINPGCTVTIDTNSNNCPGPCGGAGNISVTGAITWGSTANLILNAAGGVTVTAAITSTNAALAGGNLTITAGGTINVNNAITATRGNIVLSSGGNMTFTRSVQSTNGDVTLTAPTGSTILLNPAASQHTFVGTQNGTTFVGNPLLALCDVNQPRPDLTIQAITTNNFCSQLGFNNPTGATATGPISVACRNLFIQSTRLGRAAVGHGNSTLPNSAFSTTDAATITVDASGNMNFLVDATFNVRIGSSIGHGSLNNATNLRGNICVAAAGDITFQMPALDGGFMTIGHGTILGGNTVQQEAGDITVICGGSIQLNSRNGVMSRIGHVTPFTSGQPQMQVDGNIYVFANGSITMNSQGNGAGGEACGIGHSGGIANAIPILNSNVLVSVGQNLTINGSRAGYCGIGTRGNAINGSVSVLVGGNLLMTDAGTGINDATAIGNSQTVPNGTSNTYVAVNGNITMTPAIATALVRIRAPGDVNVAALGNIIGTTGSTPARSYISTEYNNAAATTRVFAGGNLQSLGANSFLFGEDTLTPPWLANIWLAAGTAVTVPYAIVTTTGNVTVQTSHQFAAGQLWTTNAALLATVCSQAINPALNAVGCATLCTAALQQNSSNANVPVDMAGNYQVNSISTGSGNITLQGATCPTVADFNTTPALISSTTGNINISNFRDINVNGALTTGSNNVGAIFLSACQDINVNVSATVTGTGSIQMLAGRDINVIGAATSISTTSGNITLAANNAVNANRIITSTAAGGNISITADADDSGAGDLSITANITATSGQVLLDAGFGAGAAATSSISQTGGEITSGGGDIVVQSVSNILFSGNSPTTLDTGGGMLTVQSTNGTISIDDDLVTGGGAASFTAVNISVNPPGGGAGGSVNTGVGNLTMNASNNITINGDPISLQTTSGNMFISADNNVNVLQEINSNGGGTITVVADMDDSGVGNLNIAANITTVNAQIVLDAGFGSAAGGTSSILQTGGAITSAGGDVTAQSVSDILFSGTSPVSVNTGGGALDAHSTNGTISIDEDLLTGGGNAMFDAGLDIFVNPPGGGSVLGGSVNTGAGDLSMSASRDITINGDLNSLQTTTGNIAVTADADNNGAGNLEILENITSTGSGTITLESGPIAGTNTSGIFQFSPSLVSSNGGNIVYLASGQVGVCGAGPDAITSSGGNISVTSTLNSVDVGQGINAGGGNIDGFAGIDFNLDPSFSIFPLNCMGTGGALLTTLGNIQVTALHDILVNGKVLSIQTTSGEIVLSADNDITTVQNIQSTTGNISLTSDADLDGFGNITLNGTITSTDGNISLLAGDAAGCSTVSNLSSIFQFGDVITTTGDISADAGRNISFFGNVLAPAGSIFSSAGTNTLLDGATLNILPGGPEILMISGRDMTMQNGSVILASMGARVTLVVDNCYPAPPLIGPGAFNMTAGCSINGDPRIFTARRSQNTINGLLNGINFVPGKLYADTSSEVWCTYFAFPFPYPFPALGDPYTIFYKDCLQQATNQSQIIISQFLLDLHPYNEFPGWLEQFFIRYASNEKNESSLDVLKNEGYLIRRRHLNIINHPKTFTVYVLPEE